MLQNVEVHNPLLSGQAITQSDIYLPYAVHIMLAPIPCTNEHMYTDLATISSDKVFDVAK
jgi:hypothetical protein